MQMILIPFLEMKLPRSLAEKWELETSDMEDEEKTIDLFKFLNRQVMPKEAGERSQAENSKASSSSSNCPYRSKAISSNQKKKQRVSPTSTLLGEVKQETVNNCHFCKKPGHESGNCYSAKKKSIKERWKVA